MFKSSFCSLTLIASSLVGCRSGNHEQIGEPNTAETETTAGKKGGDFGSLLSREVEMIDPAKDGWETEAFNELAGERLKELGHLLTGRSSLNEDNLSELFDQSCQISRLRPSDDLLDTTFEDDSFLIRKVRSPSPPEEGLEPIQVLNRLSSLLVETGHPHSKFKIIRVEPSKSSILTRVLVLLDAHNDSGKAVQINSEWSVLWSRDDLPLIKEISLLKYEEITTTTSEHRLFTDATRSVLPERSEAVEQLSKGLPHWIREFDLDSGVLTNGYNGLSIGDMNGDYLEDLFICQTGGIPNRLFLQTPDGSLRDHSRASGTDFLNNTRCALIIDLDNDGDNDLLLNIPLGLVFMENDGSAHFTKRAEIASTGTPASMAAADPDRDGLLDIFICGYGNVWGGLGDYEHQIPNLMHDATNGGSNTFLRNLGDWQFENQTKEVGFDHNNDRWSLAAAWEDYDNDGDLDLYVANDFGRNNLYQNQSSPGGPLKFRDLAAELGAEDLSSGMSASWGDVNNDGRPDVYVSNMFSGAGNRITTQSQFMTGASEQTRSDFLRMSRGNTLLTGGNDRFQDVSEQAGITVGRWAWASRMADFNNDGWQDILVANGFLTGEDPADL